MSYPKTDFRGLKLRFLAEKKFGKTGFLEVIDYYYRKFFGNKEDEFTVFIISVGSEVGADAIYHDGDRADTFDRFIELVDDIVDNPDDYPKMIGIDTENQLVRLAEDYVIEKSNKEREDGKKKAKSINGAYGGYNKGALGVGSEISEQLGRLVNAGKGVVTNGHTKRKEIKDKTAEDGVVKYEQVTSNLISTYDNPFAEFADIIMIGIYSYNENDEGELSSVDRIISLSSKNDRSIGSGSRYLGMPDSIKFETFGKDATADEQFKINMDNGHNLINVIKEALMGNANARGITVVDSPDAFVTKKSTEDTNKIATPKRTRAGSKSTTEVKLLNGKELWAAILPLTKDEKTGKEFKRNLVKIIAVSQVKELKAKIVENKLNKTILKKVNELVVKYSM